MRGKYLQIPSLNIAVPHRDWNPGPLALKSETLTIRLSLRHDGDG